MKYATQPNNNPPSAGFAYTGTFSGSAASTAIGKASESRNLQCDSAQRPITAPWWMSSASLVMR